MMEQGCQTTCVYCTKVHPRLEGTCPFCHGAQSYFQPAQMMDGPSARSHLLQALFALGAHLQTAAPSKDATEDLHKQLVGLLQEIQIYGFDLEQALCECILQHEAS